MSKYYLVVRTVTDPNANNQNTVTSEYSAEVSFTTSGPATTAVTVITNPAGNIITVDGTFYTAAQTFSWIPGSQHTIATATPQGSGSSRYLFVNWSDGGAASHSIMVPATATTYTANFSTQYLLITAAIPANAGTIAANPTSPDGYYSSGALVQLVVNPNSGYTFANWSGDLSGSRNPQSVTLSAARSVTANFSSSILVTIATSPPGRAITVDGSSYAAPQTFNWTPGSQHTIATSPSQGSGSTRYLFANWSDGGAISHTITAPATPTTYSANFSTQQLLNATVTPSNGGTITASPSSPDGYYITGTQVQLTAKANQGYSFNRWSGDLSESTNPQTIIMSVPRTVTASFAAPARPPSEFIEWNGDFDGDGKSDVLWRNNTTGQMIIWLMNGTSMRWSMNGISPLPMASPGLVADLDWQIHSVADFNGDHKSDILWVNTVTGQVYIWLMNGLEATAIADPATVSDLNWRIQGLADFNSDGKADFLWRHNLTGDLCMWLMDGTNISTQVIFGTVADQSWKIMKLADLNGDDKADIVWRNTNGQIYIWLMNGFNAISIASPGWVTDLNWQIKGFGDFNGDGKTDILWHNVSTGQAYIWLMNGVNMTAMDTPGSMPDLNWQIKGVADFNGDGKADILWRHNVTGQVTLWFVDGTSTSGMASSGTVLEPGWQIDSFGNFNGDKMTDILWRHSTTGQVNIWLLNGAQAPTEASPATVSDMNWKILK